jgi:CRISPR-associated protein Cas1
MVVSAKQEEIARIPLDEIAVILANAHQLSYSHNLLLKLAERGIAFIACGSNHNPAFILWAVDGHHQQAGIMMAQAQAPLPLCKQLWKQLIQAKIRFQYETLQAASINEGALREMAGRVKSGDPDNLEAQAARRYWRLLMGDTFTRNRDAEGSNAMLNYGYAVIRSCVARAVMAAGMHPSLGVFHRNRLNHMCLVDDVMEPFRPRVDFEVWKMLNEGISEVDKTSKQRLALIPLQDCSFNSSTTPISVAILRTAQSMAQCFQDTDAKKLQLPEKLFPSHCQLPFDMG